MGWKNVVKSEMSSGAHYSVLHNDKKNGKSMELLHELFPNGEANDLNFVLFSTSGVHGTYNTNEEAED